MSLIKRAFLYCIRQKVKTLILFFVFLVISTLILTGFAVRDAFGEAARSVERAVGGKLLLETDSEGNYSSSSDINGTTYTYNGDYITPEIVDAVKEVDGVAGYTSENPQGFWGAGVDFKYIPAAFNLSYTPYGEASGYTAVLSSEKSSDFDSGKYSLTEGRHITPDDKHVVMISKELADYNDLSSGDEITVYCLDSDSNVKLKIVGIFDGTEGDAQDAFSISDISANCGYVDYSTMFENFGREIDGYNFLEIYVDDPTAVQGVYDEIKALPELTGKSLKLSIDTEEYEKIESPLDSMQDLINSLIIAAALAGLAVLTLLLTLRIRERKREISIYLSIGKSKGNIYGQFLAEVLPAAFTAFAASVFLAGLTAQRAGEFLASMAGKSAAELDIQVSAQYLPPVYLTGTAIIIISAAVSSWTVLRLKPGDILSKMS